MFGNAPKDMWQRWATPDEHNRIPLATRALLVQEPSGRNVLIETGIGAFFSPDRRERYGVVESHHVLLDELEAAGLTPADIDVVVLSHLHFDHAGGLLAAWQPDTPLTLVFDNAAFVVSEGAWARAIAPTARDRASFVDGLTDLLWDTGRVELVTGDHSATLGDAYRFHRSDGHTPGLLLTELNGDDGPIVFTSDLVPARPWVHLPITMGYDRFPELVVTEKTALLADLAARNVWLAFPHDHDVAMARIAADERGSYTVTEQR